MRQLLIIALLALSQAPAIFAQKVVSGKLQITGKTRIPSIPWPAIGPEVTGGTGAGGHAYTIPAAFCAMKTPIDHFKDSSPQTITSATFSGGTVTITASGMSSWGATVTVTVVGVSPAGYNGTWGIKSNTGSTVTYALAPDPGGAGSGGTITLTPNLLGFDAGACYAAY